MKQFMRGALVVIGFFTSGSLLATSLSLHRKAQIVNVGDQVLSLEELKEREDTLDFKPLASANENTSFTTDHYWIRFSLTNTTSDLQSFYLETARPITDLAELYQIGPAGKVTLKRSGDQIPFSERVLDHRSTIFPLELAAGESYTYYLHLGSDGEVINLLLQLYEPDALIAKVYVEHVFFGFFYGILLVAALIYLFFSTQLQDRSFLLYGLYVLSIGLLQASLDGFLYQYVFPGGGWFNARMVIVSAFISIFFLGRYAETFLFLRNHSKVYTRIFKGIYIASGILLLGIFISPEVLTLSYPLANLLGLAELLLILSAMLYLRLKRIPVDVFFSIGIGFLIGGLILFILNNLGVLPNTFLTANSTKIGAALEVLFLSLSMTNRIGRLNSDRAHSQTLALIRLQEMNTLKNNFMSNISHELRTPLNAIMGSVDELMRKNSADKEAQADYEMIQHASHSLLSSINDILDYSKIEKGQLSLNPSEFDLHQHLKLLEKKWNTQASYKGIHFSFSLDPSVPENCYADADRLAQITNNLVENAIKFTPSGSIAMQIKGEKIDADHVLLKVSIQDTGVGIAPDKLDSIFSSFNQQQMDDKRQFGGLGLGLSIVSKLVELHQGTIKLESVQGKGTRCYVTLPYKVIPAKTTGLTYFPEDVQDLRDHSILVVEDNALNQLVMRKILSSWENANFDIAENGEEALEKLQAGHYDLILMDLQMPVMDGYEATQAIRRGEAHLRNSTIPIIAVTADVTEETQQKVKDLGFNEYLSKPVNSAVLYQAVVDQLNARKMAG